MSNEDAGNTFKAVDAASEQDMADILDTIEFDAGQDNLRILTAQEDSLARATILELEAKLRDLQQQVVEVSDRLHRFHVAIAPHKRLPFEVLSHILMLTLPEDGRLIRLWEEEDTPRTFLSVCKHWRAVVRKMPVLWGTVRVLNIDGLGVQNSKLHVPLCILPTLPPTGPLFITITSYPNDSTTLLLKELVVHNMSRICSLHLHIPSSTLPALFNLDAAETQHLTSLSLKLHSQVMHDPGSRHPSLLPFFKNLVNLRSLKMAFDLPAQLPCSPLLSDLLDARFPSAEITDLDLIERNALEVRDIERILQRFPKLRTFSARIYWSSADGGLPMPLDDLYRPFLRSLVLKSLYYEDHRKRVDRDLTFSLARHRPLNIGWDTLYHLDLGDTVAFDLLTICVILRQCTALMTFVAELDSLASNSMTPALDVGIITLPMLSNMKLKLSDEYLLDRLTLPKLRYFKIRLESPVNEQPLVVPAITSMLSRSGCVLITLSISGAIQPMESEIEQLLLIVPEVIKFELNGQQVRKEPYERISSDMLLPYIDTYKHCNAFRRLAIANSLPNTVHSPAAALLCMK
ncbi:hypothetical protein DXG03_009772 [Asterophora parasitica]|uniref:F-box domain-containing protein n=1 Tax=Asterophora parasitica TaxID=117018 RepID=A0A9P7G3Q3_9AGAR|nr:hypothetical protein DXG03_009772 [Asterophora parasitica]